MTLFQEFKYYSQELKLSVILGTLLPMTFFRILYSYSLIIITKDFDDEDEIRISKIFVIIGSFLQVIFQILTSLVEINKSRKHRIIAGFLISIGVWVAVLFTYATDVSFLIFNFLEFLDCKNFVYFYGHCYRGVSLTFILYYPGVGVCV